jgi:hypothetical protein
MLVLSIEILPKMFCIYLYWCYMYKQFNFFLLIYPLFFFINQHFIKCSMNLFYITCILFISTCFCIGSHLFPNKI